MHVFVTCITKPSTGTGLLMIQAEYLRIVTKSGAAVRSNVLCPLEIGDFLGPGLGSWSCPRWCRSRAWAKRLRNRFRHPTALASFASCSCVYSLATHPFSQASPTSMTAF